MPGMFNLFKKHLRKRLRSQPFPPFWLDIIHKNVPILARVFLSGQEFGVPTGLADQDHEGSLTPNRHITCELNRALGWLRLCVSGFPPRTVTSGRFPQGLTKLPES